MDVNTPTYGVTSITDTHCLAPLGRLLSVTLSLRPPLEP